MAKLADYVTQTAQTTSTVADQQYYHYPPGLVSIDAITIAVGTLAFPLTPIYGQATWDAINQYPITNDYPRFFFPRRDDFGVWPIPQDTHTLTFNSFVRDRNLSIDDYTTGTVAVTSGSTTLTGTGTTFTAAMVGRWFTINDPTVVGQGYWYRVRTFSSTTVLVLEEAWQGSTASGATYRIGESPEMPEEGHVLLIDGPTADFYAGLRNDSPTATWFNNKFWTGDGDNNFRVVGEEDKVSGGLIGLMNRYASRTKKRLILKRPSAYLPLNKIWGTTIS